MQKPKIYTVGTAHLDTTWCWNFETTLREYIPKTLKDNFYLLRNIRTISSILKAVIATSLWKSIILSFSKS